MQQSRELNYKVATMFIYGCLAICAIVLVLMVYRYDMYDREPWYMLVVAILLGILACVTVGKFEDYLFFEFESFFRGDYGLEKEAFITIHTLVLDPNHQVLKFSKPLLRVVNHCGRYTASLAADFSGFPQGRGRPEADGGSSLCWWAPTRSPITAMPRPPRKNYEVHSD